MFIAPTLEKSFAAGAGGMWNRAAIDMSLLAE